MKLPSVRSRYLFSPSQPPLSPKRNQSAFPPASTGVWISSGFSPLSSYRPFPWFLSSIPSSQHRHRHPYIVVVAFFLLSQVLSSILVEVNLSLVSYQLICLREYVVATSLLTYRISVLRFLLTVDVHFPRTISLSSSSLGFSSLGCASYHHSSYARSQYLRKRLRASEVSFLCCLAFPSLFLRILWIDPKNL